LTEDPLEETDRNVLSQKAKYALRALLALAEQPSGSPLLISQIADSQRIPKRFLEQILLDLKFHGLVASRRGKHGGYVLVKPADLISLADVVRLIDGPIAPLPCLSRTAYERCGDCDPDVQCHLRQAFADAHAANLRVLEATTVESMLRKRPATAASGATG
jgi:Rrf2 family protein